MSGIYIENYGKGEGQERFEAFTMIQDMEFKGIGPTQKAALKDLCNEIKNVAVKHFKQSLKESESALQKATARYNKSKDAK